MASASLFALMRSFAVCSGSADADVCASTFEVISVVNDAEVAVAPRIL